MNRFLYESLNMSHHNQYESESILGREQFLQKEYRIWLEGSDFKGTVIELIPLIWAKGRLLRNYNYVIIIGTCHVIQNSNFGFDGRGGFKGGFCGLLLSDVFFGGFSGIFGGRTGWKLKTSFEVGLVIGVVSFLGIGGGTFEPNISSVDLNIWILIEKGVNRVTIR